MYKYLEDSLRKFIKETHVAHIENNGSRMWYEVVNDTGFYPKPVINVVFSRYQHTEVSQTILSNYGIVLAIPSYWIDVDPGLVILFLSQYIDPWLKQYFGYNPDSGNIGSGSSGNGNNCNCDGSHKPHHPMPPPPPPKPGMAPPPPPHTIQIESESPYKYGYPVPPGE